MEKGPVSPALDKSPSTSPLETSPSASKWFPFSSRKSKDSKDAKDAAALPALELIDRPAQNDASPESGEDTSKHLKGKKLVIAFVSMLLSVLLIAIDQTILAPALGPITAQFEALDRVSWIVSGYFLTQCSLALFYGQLLRMMPRRTIFFIAVSLFEVGSLICAVAPSMNILILGRAVAGSGAAGIFVSVLAIISEIAPLKDRPKLFGTFGAVFGISSVCGPLLGGAFTSKVTWRWCFYINLPVGGITLATILLTVPHTPAPPLSPELVQQLQARWKFITRGKYQPRESSLLFKLLSLDYPATTFMIGMITCLLLALQWGGVRYAWSNPVMWAFHCGGFEKLRFSDSIGLFVCFGGLIVMLVVLELFTARDFQLLPLRFLRNRTIVGCMIQTFSMFFAFNVLVYYIEIFFEVVHRHSPVKAGLDILPFMLCAIGVSIIAGIIVSKTGRYWPLLVCGPSLISVGSGLLFTVTPTTPTSRIDGYQVIAAVALGFCMQNGLIAAQAAVSEIDGPQASSFVILFQLVGGVLGIAIAGQVFNSKLAHYLVQYAPTSNIQAIISSTTVVWDESIVDAAIRPAVIQAYVKALNYVFLIGVPLGIVSIGAGLLMKNINIREKAATMAVA